ncbi:MAG: hypothetical protein KDJ35_01325 [Alphaproteobacteria bacterium]|nr:hypothetical protein [Alphaproteobacteria bacterium]
MSPKSEKSHLVSYTLPKADMHTHISLALSPEQLLKKIQLNRTTLDLDFLLHKPRRYYSNLWSFHAETYEKLRGSVEAYELAIVTQTYLERIAKEGAIYAEISNSFRDPAVFEMQMDAVVEGIKAAKENTGIEARIVVTSLRDYGSSKAEKAAKHLVGYKNPYVTGFGLVGYERADSLQEYKTALNIAWHEAGLGIAPHVAEQDIVNAIDFFKCYP